MRGSRKVLLPLFAVAGFALSAPLAVHSQEEDEGVTFTGADVGGLSFGGDYDFSYKHVNNMRKAWLICATTAFQEGECPEVFEKCHKPPLLERRNGKLRSKCPKPPTFSDLQADAAQALRDAARFAGVPDFLGDASGFIGAAMQMAETAGSPDSCSNSAFADLCEQARALDQQNLSPETVERAAISSFLDEEDLEEISSDESRETGGEEDAP